VTNSSDQNPQEESVQERPAWLIPVLVAAGIVTLSILFLYYYFGPTPREILGLAPEASERTVGIEAIVGTIRYVIPENYTRYPVQRAGGVQREIALHALLPNLEPYSLSKRALFESNTPDSPVIYITLREAGVTLPAEQRMRRVYEKYLDDEAPERDLLGMDHYRMRQNSGYRDQDLFVYHDERGRLALLLCYRLTPLIDSPNCSRTLLLTDTVAVSYRYKRAHRANWLEIDRAVLAAIREFDATPTFEDSPLYDDLDGGPQEDNLEGGPQDPLQDLSGPDNGPLSGSQN